MCWNQLKQFCFVKFERYRIAVEAFSNQSILVFAVRVCLFFLLPTLFLCNHLLLKHDYPSSSNFYHQGKTTINLIAYFSVTITHVLVQTVNTRGKYQWCHSSSIPTRTRWRLGAIEVLVSHIVWLSHKLHKLSNT